MLTLTSFYAILKNNAPYKRRLEKNLPPAPVQNAKYRIVTLIVSRIYKNKLIKEIWHLHDTPFSQMLKINFRETFPERDDYAPILTPEAGFPVNKVDKSRFKTLLKVILPQYLHRKIFRISICKCKPVVNTRT